MTLKRTHRSTTPPRDPLTVALADIVQFLDRKRALRLAAQADTHTGASESQQ